MNETSRTIQICFEHMAEVTEEEEEEAYIKLINFLDRCEPININFSVTEEDLMPIRLREDWWTRRYGYWRN